MNKVRNIETGEVFLYTVLKDYTDGRERVVGLKRLANAETNQLCDFTLSESQLKERYESAD